VGKGAHTQFTTHSKSVKRHVSKRQRGPGTVGKLAREHRANKIEKGVLRRAVLAIAIRSLFAGVGAAHGRRRRRRRWRQAVLPICCPADHEVHVPVVVHVEFRQARDIIDSEKDTMPSLAPPEPPVGTTPRWSPHQPLSSIADEMRPLPGLMSTLAPVGSSVATTRSTSP
jgi:hypothetical protein